MPPSFFMNLNNQILDSSSPSLILNRREALRYRYPFLLLCYYTDIITKVNSFEFLPLFIKSDKTNFRLCNLFETYNNKTLSVLYKRITPVEFKDYLLNVRHLEFDKLRGTYKSILMLPPSNNKYKVLTTTMEALIPNYELNLYQDLQLFMHLASLVQYAKNTITQNIN